MEDILSKYKMIKLRKEKVYTQIYENR